MQGDIFATKGIEYLITIGYLLLLVGLAWGFGIRRFARAAAAPRPRPAGPAGWFRIAEGFGFHQGHAWAAPGQGAGDVVKVGLDEFAAWLLGDPDRLELPPVGATVREGGPGWTVGAGERVLPMLSPVGGEVVAVNPALAGSPRLAGHDPYGAGWLMQVKVAEQGGWRRNLLTGELASFWMRRTAERLRELVASGSGELGAVLPDGGAPARGLARALDREQWDRVTREFFLVG